MLSITNLPLVVNFSNTKSFKKPEKWLKPWHMVTHLRVFSESYPMNTNITEFRWFSKIFASLWFSTKVAVALEGLKNIKKILKMASFKKNYCFEKRQHPSSTSKTILALPWIWIGYYLVKVALKVTSRRSLVSPWWTFHQKASRDNGRTKWEQLLIFHLLPCGSMEKKKLIMEHSTLTLICCWWII